MTFLAFEERVATWRTLWPARELRRRGYDVKIHARSAGEDAKAEMSEDVTYVLHITNRAWKFMERVMTQLSLAKMFAQAGRLVLNVDDDWTRMLEVQPRPIPPLARIVYRDIPELFGLASRIVVATPRLAEVCSEFNDDVVLCENYLPEWVFDLPKQKPLERVAWMGEMFLHGQDWNALSDHVWELPPLRLIGAGTHAKNLLRLWGAKDVGATDAIFDQRKLYKELGRAVLAMIPLTDTEFNRGKSWIKPMEFAARGVYPVAEDHPEYRRLAERIGAPEIARGPADLVARVRSAWETRPSGEELPDRLRAAGMTMEALGGDQWEKALT